MQTTVFLFLFLLLHLLRLELGKGGGRGRSLGDDLDLRSCSGSHATKSSKTACRRLEWGLGGKGRLCKRNKVKLLLFGTHRLHLENLLVSDILWHELQSLHEDPLSKGRKLQHKPSSDRQIIRSSHQRIKGPKEREKECDQEPTIVDKPVGVAATRLLRPGGKESQDRRA